MTNGKKFNLAKHKRGTQESLAWDKYPYWWSMSYDVKVNGLIEEPCCMTIGPKLSLAWNMPYNVLACSVRPHSCTGRRKHNGFMAENKCAQAYCLSLDLFRFWPLFPPYQGISCVIMSPFPQPLLAVTWNGHELCQKTIRPENCWTAPLLPSTFLFWNPLSQTNPAHLPLMTQRRRKPRQRTRYVSPEGNSPQGKWKIPPVSFSCAVWLPSCFVIVLSCSAALGPNCSKEEAHQEQSLTFQLLLHSLAWV